MKKRLDQFTMAQFIDIVCGDYSSIVCEPEMQVGVAESLISQYNSVSDPAHAKARLLEQTKLAKSKCKIVLYRILSNLISVFEAYDEVRDIMRSIGHPESSLPDDGHLLGMIEHTLHGEELRRKRMMHEMSEMNKAAREQMSEEDTRRSFDEQTARLMAHFKFAINHGDISASVYANLVNMACRQQRQQASKK